VLCAASAITLVVLGARLTFFHDDWGYLLQRPDGFVESVLTHHNGHLVALPALAYKGLVAAFGMESALSFRVVNAAVVVALALMVFAFVRERAGDVLALVAAAILLFLGPAWEGLLFFSTVNLVGAMAAGVGALLALQRDTPARNAIACGLILVSILMSGVGLSFVLAAAVAVLLRRRPAQLWIAAIPGVVFAAWYLTYGNDAPSTFGINNVGRTPQYVLDAVASGLTSLLGLTQSPSGQVDAMVWGRAALVLALVGVFIWLHRGGRPKPFALVVGTAALSFWVLAAFNFTPGREPQSGRYMLMTATFLVLFAAELFRPVRLSRALLATVAAIGVLVVGANLSSLNEGYKFLRKETALARADLGVLEIGRSNIDPGLQLTEEIAGSSFLHPVTADAYLQAADRHGSPAYSAAEIAAAAPELRRAADGVLAAGYGLGLGETDATRPPPGAVCERLDVNLDGSLRELELTGSEVQVSNVGVEAAEIGVRRFAPSGLPVILGNLPAGFSARFAVPEDSVPRPWYLTVAGGSPVRACAA
jgi:hypothetical protein